jgi:predicted membrane-bound spermidine synthase
MSFRHIFFPQTIKFPDTNFNHRISLRRYFLQPTLYVDGLIESGDILTHIWKTGIKKLVPQYFTPRSILILGLGGGSNTLLVSHLYPKARITAVEIDPLMVQIGKKYFGLTKVKNLHIIVADALDFARNLKPARPVGGSESYDLILVDCFEGKYIPKKLEDLGFLQSLKDHSRYTLINRIHWYDHHRPTMDFMKSLSTRFVFVTARTMSNLIISLV